MSGKVDKEYRGLVRTIENNGYIVDYSGGGHLKVKNPDGGLMMMMPSTPSSRSSIRNSTATAKRLGLLSPLSASAVSHRRRLSNGPTKEQPTAAVTHQNTTSGKDDLDNRPPRTDPANEKGRDIGILTGAAVRTARTGLQMSVAEFSRSIGVSEAELVAMESGSRLVSSEVNDAISAVVARSLAEAATPSEPEPDMPDPTLDDASNPSRRRDWLSQFQDRYHLSRPMMADAFGVSTGVIRSWERGKSTTDDPESVWRAMCDLMARYRDGVGMGPEIEPEQDTATRTTVDSEPTSDAVLPGHMSVETVLAAVSDMMAATRLTPAVERFRSLPEDRREAIMDHWDEVGEFLSFPRDLRRQMVTMVNTVRTGG